MPAGADHEPDTLLDTSAAVAVVVADHDAHAATLDAVDGLRLGLAGPAWFETYSVLTRLPPPARRPEAEVARLLAENFASSRFLDARTQRSLGPELARLGIAGGAVYDALVAAVARRHELPLTTRDRRAASVYRALDVEVRLLG